MTSDLGQVLVPIGGIDSQGNLHDRAGSVARRPRMFDHKTAHTTFASSNHPRSRASHGPATE